MTEKKKEVKLSVEERDIPADILQYKDPVYGERIFVRNGTLYEEKTKPSIKPIRVHKDRDYAMKDAASFVTVLQNITDIIDGIIFYTEDKITAFLNESSRQEKVTLPLAKSLEMQAFFNDDENEGAGVFEQKEFLKLIDTFPECISAEGTSPQYIRANVEKMQLSTEIQFASNLDKDNLEFVYKEKGGTQTGRLPKKITLCLPYYEGSENKIYIHVDLDVQMPKSEGEKPVFAIVDVKHQRTMRDALKKEIKSLEEKLGGWTFVHGQ